MRVGDRIIRGGFISDFVEMAIPPAAGNSDVVELVEIDVEIGLGEDGE